MNAGIHKNVPASQHTKTAHEGEAARGDKSIRRLKDIGRGAGQPVRNGQGRRLRRSAPDAKGGAR